MNLHASQNVLDMWARVTLTIIYFMIVDAHHKEMINFTHGLYGPFQHMT